MIAALTLAAYVATATLPADAPVDSRAREETPDRIRDRVPMVATFGAAFVALGIGVFALGDSQRASAGVGVETPAQQTAQRNVIGGLALVGFGACTMALAVSLWEWTKAPPEVSAVIAPDGSSGSIVFTRVLP